MLKLPDTNLQIMNNRIKSMQWKTKLFYRIFQNIGIDKEISYTVFHSIPNYIVTVVN